MQWPGFVIQPPVDPETKFVWTGMIKPAAEALLRIAVDGQSRSVSVSELEIAEQLATNIVLELRTLKTAMLIAREQKAFPRTGSAPPCTSSTTPSAPVTPPEISATCSTDQPKTTSTISPGPTTPTQFVDNEPTSPPRKIRKCSPTSNLPTTQVKIAELGTETKQDIQTESVQLSLNNQTETHDTDQDLPVALRSSSPGSSAQNSPVDVKQHSSPKQDQLQLMGSFSPRPGSGNLGDLMPIKRKRGRPPVKKPLCCADCGTSTTPEWRRGQNGPNTYPSQSCYKTNTCTRLCNACGLQFSKKCRAEREARRRNSIANVLNPDETHQEPLSAPTSVPASPSPPQPILDTDSCEAFLRQHFMQKQLQQLQIFQALHKSTTQLPPTAQQLQHKP